MQRVEDMAAAAPLSKRATDRLIAFMAKDSPSVQERIEGIQHALAEGADINVHTPRTLYRSLLQQEISKVRRTGYQDVVLFMIQLNQIDLSLADQYGDTALHTAAMMAWTTPAIYPIMHEIMVKDPSIINLQNKDGITALHTLVSIYLDPNANLQHPNMHLAAIVEMIQMGADIDLENSMGRSVRTMLDHPRMIRYHPRVREQILAAADPAAASSASSSTSSSAAQQGGRSKCRSKRKSKSSHKRNRKARTRRVK